MSLGQAIAPHLPYLRRYGRAISGSQQRGDALVAGVLQTLVANSGAVDTSADLRIQLYRMVHDNFGLAIGNQRTSLVLPDSSSMSRDFKPLASGAN